VAHPAKWIFWNRGNLSTDLTSALRTEAAQFPLGRILPFATKAPSGLIAYGGWNGQSDTVTMLDGGTGKCFQASDIDPFEPAHRPTTGHGYDPFRNSDLWVDKAGFLHTRVLEHDYEYADGKWNSSTLTQQKDSVIPPPPVEKDGPELTSDTFSNLAT
jgi:hypothetical protein